MDVFSFLKLKNRKAKHDTSPCAQEKKEKEKPTWVKDKLKHRLIRLWNHKKNSQTGFNSLLRTYSVQNFVAKTRVKILNFIKREAMLKSHTDSI